MRTAATLLAALVMGSAALAAPPRTAPATPRFTQNRPPAQTDAGAPAPPSPTCCCRAWSHGWQHAWRTERECAGLNGTCVSPEHC